MSGQHARLSASSAYRWTVCAGSVEAGKGRDSTSAYAAEGTYAHSIAAECLERLVLPEKWLGSAMNVEGHIVGCTQEMVDAINVYREFAADHTPVGSKVWYEMKLDVLKKLDEDFGGTADFVNYHAHAKHLLVADFKYGSGVYVDPKENLQAIIYAIGAMMEVDKPVETVEVVIVQPRFTGADPVRRWTFKAYDVMERVALLKEAAVLTRQKNAPLVAGDHCQFCPAARDCPELEKKHHAVVAADFDTSVALPDGRKLSDTLAAIPLVKARIKAIEEYAYDAASRGMTIPGYKLVDKRATRKWKSEGEVVLWAEKQAIDPYEPREVVSPAQMEKRMGMSKKKAEQALETFVEKVSSGTVLVTESDNRPPAKIVQAEDFALIEGNADKTNESIPLSLLP